MDFITGNLDNDGELSFASLNFLGIMDEVRISNIARSLQEFNLPPEPPTIDYPVIGTTGFQLPGTISWNPSNGALSYRFQVSTNTRFFDSHF